MCDLEEQILKRNVPGKCSWWDKDSDEEGKSKRCNWLDPDASDPEQEMSEMDRQRRFVEAEVPDPIRRSVMANREKERARTGVKGVLADHAAYTDAVLADDKLQKEYREAALWRMAEGARYTSAPASAPSAVVNRDDDEEDEDDPILDDFLQQYRKQRLLELQSTSTLPVFGQIKEVCRKDFITEVDEVDPRCYVVVHVYEGYVKSCQLMNRHLEALARQKQSVKFLRMLSSEVDPDNGYDAVALPTIMIYRAKELVACLTRVTDDLGEAFTLADVEWLLQEQNVFEAIAVGKKEKAEAASQLKAVAYALGCSDSEGEPDDGCDYEDD